MKYICLGYFDEARWESLPESERHSIMERCSAYDDELRRGGHFGASCSSKHATSTRPSSSCRVIPACA